MKLVEEIFEKATVRGFVDYLLYGLPPESEERNYQARLDEPYLEYEKVALEYDSNGASELLSFPPMRFRKEKTKIHFHMIL